MGLWENAWQPPIVARRRRTPLQGTQKMQIPTWTINRVRMKSQNPNRNRTRRTQIHTGQNSNKQNLYMVVPYHQGISEEDMQQVWGTGSL